MLLQRLIPTVLLKNGRLVKGQQYSQYRDAGNPRTTARAHNYQGADELLVLDIMASVKKEWPDIEAIKTIAEECFMPLCVGGGIVSAAIAAACLDAGADKICLTTSALDNPKLITQLAHQFGSQAIVVGIDMLRDQTGVPRLFDHRTHGLWSQDPWEWMKTAVTAGAGEIRLMSVVREGTLQGYDIDLFKKARAMVNVPIILEGGAGSLHHIQQAFEAGIDGIATGAMLVFSDANLVKIKQHMITAECPIRA